MKIEDQVLTIEQARHLQELGLDMSDAALCWSCPLSEPIWVVFQVTEGIRDVLKGNQPYVTTPVIPTYTLQEVLDKIPETVFYDIKGYHTYYTILFHDYSICCVNEDNYFALSWSMKNGQYLSAAYKCLCWVLENGYMKKERK